MAMNLLPALDKRTPVLIAGPTASGKSDLALRIARTMGGVVVNADASQVYGCWRVITARPAPEEMGGVPHHLYGHVDWRRSYSAGDWLRDASPFLSDGMRPIIVGGTGLFFAALTEGLAPVPPVPAEVRTRADQMELADLLEGLDAATRARIDPQNRARVQRAWEVLSATGRGLADWQARTPPPLLPPGAFHGIVLHSPKDWLEARMRRRFDAMLAGGALDEVAAMRPHYDPGLPAFRAIGVPELTAYLDGHVDLETARERAIIATRRYAKRQRTWFRARMAGWQSWDATLDGDKS